MGELIPLRHDPLMQPVEYNGQEFFTSQYFHRLYRENAGLLATHRLHKNFLQLLRAIPIYDILIERGDIVELSWDHTKMALAENLSQWKTLFLKTGYQPLTLINSIAQGELSHHLDDELSKQMAYAADTLIARHAKHGSEIIPDEAKRALEVRQYAAKLIEADKRLDALFGIPEHMTLTESVKSLRVLIGVDFSEKLLSSPKIENLSEEVEHAASIPSRAVHGPCGNEENAQPD